MAGDIDTLQGRIAAIRTWAYICQRPDWVLARDEMAARAHAVEAKLSDALHGRLTERFVNRRTTILMKSLGQDASALPIEIDEDGAVSVDGEHLGRVEGLRFTVDPSARHEDRRMLLAAAEKALPRLLGQQVEALVAAGVAVRWCQTTGEQCHAKTLQVVGKQRQLLLLGSGNFTRRNLDDYNLETDIVIRGPVGDSLLALSAQHFDMSWNNEGGRIHSAAYDTHAGESWWLRWQYRFMEASGIGTF
jgi:hypothetical protein